MTIRSQLRFSQSLFAVHRHQVGDDLLLIGDAHRQVAHEALKQRVAANTREELATRIKANESPQRRWSFFSS